MFKTRPTLSLSERQQSQQDYRSAAKGTAIFGGVQVFQILINIVRGKFVAVFLGPEGMGIMSLFTSTANTINQFSSCGLSLSAVRDISQANEKGDIKKLSRVAAVFRRLTTFTGLFAATIAIFGAPWLSELTFGTRDYTIGFMALAIMLFLTAKAVSETSILQGTRQLKSLAKSTLIGALTGLFIGIPLYVFFGNHGIVPAMIVSSATIFLTNRYFTSKIKLEKQPLTSSDAFREGQSMISLGVVMMISTLIGTAVVYVVNVYVRVSGGAGDVGFYQAASSITNQYVGVVFTAMAIDYAPRLMAISMDNKKVAETVSRQIEIVMLVVAPLVVTILVSAPLVIKILLTDNFLPIIPLMSWLALSLIFKAFIYPIGYISFSKGDKKTFFWLEGIFGNALMLVMNIVGYSLFGIIGLGISTLSMFVIAIFVLLVVTRIKYDFRLPFSIVKLILPIIGISVTAFALFVNVGYTWQSYLAGLLLLGASIAYSYYHLNKMIGIKDLINIKLLKKPSSDDQ